MRIKAHYYWVIFVSFGPLLHLLRLINHAGDSMNQRHYTRFEPSHGLVEGLHNLADDGLMLQRYIIQPHHVMTHSTFSNTSQRGDDLWCILWVQNESKPRIDGLVQDSALTMELPLISFDIATICQQVCCVRWGQLSVFYKGTSLLDW